MQGSEQTPKAPLGNNARPLQPLHHRTVRTNIDFQNAKVWDDPTGYSNIIWIISFPFLFMIFPMIFSLRTFVLCILVFVVVCERMCIIYTWFYEKFKGLIFAIILKLKICSTSICCGSYVFTLRYIFYDWKKIENFQFRNDFYFLCEWNDWKA